MRTHTRTIRSVTYLGARAKVHTIGSQASGHRVVLTEWIDDAVGQPVEHRAGTIVGRHISGDFEKDTGRHHGEKQVFASLEDAEAWVATL